MPYNPSRDEFLVNTEMVGQQFFPALTRLASGNILAVWASEPAGQRVITAQMFDAGGNRIGSPFNLTAPTAGSQISPDVVPLSNDGFALSWTAAPGAVSHIKIQFFDGSGVPTSPETVLDPASSFSSHDSDMAILANGSVAIAWTGNDGAGAEIGGAIVSPNGMVQYFPVNTTASGHQTVPSVAALAGGNFVVTWSDFSGLGGDSDGGIKAQIFDPAGARVGGEFLVNTNTPGPQSPSFVEALPSGGFVVVWNGFGQLFDAAGNKAGGEFPIPGAEALAVLPDGGFVVSYQASDGDFNGVYAQHYAADATPVGGSFQVNQVTANQQILPDITTLVTGDLLVAWMDHSGANGDPDGFGIMARTFTTGTLGTPGHDVFFLGTPGDDHFLGLGGDDLMSGGLGGDDRLDGGAGDDNFYFGDTLAGTDIVVGGPGVDRVILAGQYPDLNLTATSLFGVEAIVLQSGRFALSGFFEEYYSYRITTADENVAAGGLLTLNGANLKVEEPVIFDGSAETDGVFFLQGGAGNDSLTGGAGADTMAGGRGDDVYFVDDAGDVVIEAVGGGASDAVYTRANYTLRPGQEIELLAGNGLAPGQGIALTGNEFAQTLIGGAANDILAGRGGNDVLTGNDGVDQLDGGAGIDMMAGGAGNDIYFVDNAADIVQEGAGGGADTVYASVDFTLSSSAQVELLAANGLAPGRGIVLSGNGFAQSVTGGSGNDTLSGGGGNDFLFGGAGDDHLVGGAGADVIEGGAGFDRMFGGVGDDIFYVENAGDVVFESGDGGAFDSVYASVNYVLGSDAAVELLASKGLAPGQGIALQGNEHSQTVVGAAGNDILAGGGGNDVLTGNDGIDQLDGGFGIDAMAGGDGNDIYFVDHASDVIQEFAGGGADTVYASAGFALSSSAEVETLAANGLAPGQGILLAGNDFAQSIAGGSGNDTLLGGGGSDLIDGGAGADLIDGGAGLDGLRGGGGEDIFRFLSATDSNGAGDSLYDFVSGTDRIDLAAIDANNGVAGDQAFAFIGSGAFTNVAGQLRAELSDGILHIFGDVNGDGAADLHILAYNAPGIVASDFIL